MRVIPRYDRYEPGGGFRPAPESGVVCALCCYEIGSQERTGFSNGQVCHAQCLAERSDDDGK